MTPYVDQSAQNNARSGEAYLQQQNRMRELMQSHIFEQQNQQQREDWSKNNMTAYEQSALDAQKAERDQRVHEATQKGIVNGDLQETFPPGHPHAGHDVDEDFGDQQSPAQKAVAQPTAAPGGFDFKTMGQAQPSPALGDANSAMGQGSPGMAASPASLMLPQTGVSAAPPAIGSTTPSQTGAGLAGKDSGPSPTPATLPSSGGSAPPYIPDHIDPVTKKTYRMVPVAEQNENAKQGLIDATTDYIKNTPNLDPDDINILKAIPTLGKEGGEAALKIFQAKHTKERASDKINVRPDGSTYAVGPNMPAGSIKPEDKEIGQKPIAPKTTQMAVPDGNGGSTLKEFGNNDSIPAGAVSPSQLGARDAADYKQKGASLKAATDAQNTYNEASTYAKMQNGPGDIALLMQVMGAVKPENIGKMRFNKAEQDFILDARNTPDALQANLDKVRAGSLLGKDQRQQFLSVLGVQAHARARDAGLEDEQGNKLDPKSGKVIAPAPVASGQKGSPGPNVQWKKRPGESEASVYTNDGKTFYDRKTNLPVTQ